MSVFINCYVNAEHYINFANNEIILFLCTNPDIQSNSFLAHDSVQKQIPAGQSKGKPRAAALFCPTTSQLPEQLRVLSEPALQAAAINLHEKH